MNIQNQENNKLKHTFAKNTPKKQKYLHNLSQKAEFCGTGAGKRPFE